LNFLYGVLVGLLVREIAGWLPRLSKWMLDSALRRVPEATREQRRSEWLAEQEALPDAVLTKFAHGLYCYGRASGAKPAVAEALLRAAFFTYFLRLQAGGYFKEPVSLGTLKERWALCIGIWNELLFDDPTRPYPIRDLLSKIRLLREFSEKRDQIADALRKQAAKDPEERRRVEEALAALDEPKFQKLFHELKPLEETFEKVKDDLREVREKIKANRSAANLNLPPP
jgi:hypothetical protein